MQIIESGKYDFTLDMDTENSNSAILKNIAPNSKVLEIGCAYGRMTKYLKENLHCRVTIVESDMTAANIACQWADNNHSGAHFGNIESEIVRDRIVNYAEETFDYIIFADVLEHLHEPQIVLNEIKKLLNPEGSIWISVPNISHNAVLIDLWNDKFTYREAGLLDNTHLRFFTESSLDKMVKDCNLVVNKAFNLKNVVENTEFKNSYDDVPATVALLLKRRDHGETYQFVWELKVKA
jgi:2-polyprenyl-3-methyl-5-hydroxy-6-metoxy-1,4-benzoquinol methylase